MSYIQVDDIRCVTHSASTYRQQQCYDLTKPSHAQSSVHGVDVWWIRQVATTTSGRMTLSALRRYRVHTYLTQPCAVRSAVAAAHCRVFTVQGSCPSTVDETPSNSLSGTTSPLNSSVQHLEHITGRLALSLLVCIFLRV